MDMGNLDIRHTQELILETKRQIAALKADATDQAKGELRRLTEYLHYLVNLLPHRSDR